MTSFYELLISWANKSTVQFQYRLYLSNLERSASEMDVRVRHVSLVRQTSFLLQDATIGTKICSEIFAKKLTQQWDGPRKACRNIVKFLGKEEKR